MGGGTMPQRPSVPQLSSNLEKLSPPPPSSSSFSSSNNLKPPNANTTLSTSISHSNKPSRELMPVDPKEVAKKANSSLYDHVFETVPSQREVEDAISALLNFIEAVSSSSSNRQITSSSDSSIFLSEGYKRLYDTIQLLQTDPAIKRLVVSLSSDKAIWDAVMSHVRHQKLLEMPDSDENKTPQNSEENELAMYLLSWILQLIKGKVWELIENFQSLVNDFFHSPKMQHVDPAVLHEKLRSSLLLCIVILLIVIMARLERS
ncbi:hypothetical protein HN51_041708 [Arachis hypogaea]|uniref:Uncharacterized protein n=1 Tax=Arachis hypogaea TaxID=3818 RepID=A0A444YTR7_ARAHY|nr:uncharacterized protein LOC107605284 isoform X1 [Arachis ipaensis]XP_025659078.1 uncharacterized protein LOC112755303 isoform X1 [Arachis hypogaea]QHN87526.1 uncharacterized protein DS421_16g555870 [Arachis hypogaea]RYR05306.1 hypothetical protein Ahy_B06g085172 isoform B [Arachis hypogaea]